VIKIKEEIKEYTNIFAITLTAGLWIYIYFLDPIFGNLLIEKLKIFIGIALSFLIIGISIIKIGLEKYFYLRKIENTETSKIRSVAIGLTEVYGKAIPKEEKYCLNEKEKSVYYSFDIMRYSSGGNQGKWTSILKEEFYEKFYLKDETGQILINPKEAKIDVPVIKYEGYLFERKGFNKLISGSTLLPEEIRYHFITKMAELFKDYQRDYFRIEKKVIRENEHIYVIGEVQKDKENVIRKGNQNIFLISNRDEKELLSKYKLNSFIRIIIGSTLFILSLMMFLLIIK